MCACVCVCVSASNDIDGNMQLICPERSKRLAGWQSPARRAVAALVVLLISLVAMATSRWPETAAAAAAAGDSSSSPLQSHWTPRQAAASLASSLNVQSAGLQTAGCSCCCCISNIALGPTTVAVVQLWATFWLTLLWADCSVDPG